MKLLTTVLALLGLAIGSQTLAQTYPSSPITLVVPFAAGSGTDAVARVIAQKLSDRLRQQVVVDNKPGASAQIGAVFVARAKPDGYTLFMTTNTSHSANPSLFQNLKYDPIKDFTPIVRTGELPFALVVANHLPIKSMKELIDYAKANPGKLSYATPNSTSLVASETLKRMAAVNMVGVPYKSSPQAMTDVVGGQIELYVTDFGSGLAMIKADKVRALAVTPANGSKILPNIPAVAQTLPGFDLTSWNGIFGPAGLPKPIVDRISTEVIAILAEKEVQDRLAVVGFEVMPSASPEVFEKYVADQLTLWTRLIKQAGIKPE
ncbi:Bug family tripartite tricarboxylate transporter substrate binding protein [Polaromonas sp.]|uniref:Bug family tripartite tricarboxylate transporter substrate binding protein n=1 Tax=Polaromonas sp. TaxID=1869339 RepID=UPI003750BB3A